MSDSLPPRPDLGQLRHLAKELKTAAQAGEPAALARIRAHLPTGQITLSAAQLAIAREHGFPNWPRLKAHVEASVTAERVREFLNAITGGARPRAAALLARDPSIARYDFRTAVVLGDVPGVRDLLASDPALASRPDPQTGWPPLLDACRSCWHRIAPIELGPPLRHLDPARSRDLAEVTRLLLDGGANPNTTVVTGWRSPTHISALWAAVAHQNAAIIRLLLERGARPDHGTFAVAAVHPTHLRLLLGYASLPADSAVLSGPIDDGMTEAVRILLEAGADPNRLLPGSTFRDVDPDEDFDEDKFFAAMEREYPPIHPLSAAVKSDAPAELITLLLEHGAFDSAAVALARRYYRTEIVELLERFGHQ